MRTTAARADVMIATVAMVLAPLLDEIAAYHQEDGQECKGLEWTKRMEVFHDEVGLYSNGFHWIAPWL